MPSLTESLRLAIEADTKGAVASIEKLGATTERELGRSTKSLDKLGTGLSKVGLGAIAFGGTALVGLGMAASAATDLGEAVNASNVVFGSASKTIDEYAKTSAKSMGLSERAFREALVPVGAMLKNVGLSEQEAADQSVKLAQRAADMASVFNTDVTTALEAIQAGLRGEADPLERFGVGLNEAAVNAKAVELGLAATTSEVDANAKAQARLALIYEQTSGFAGDFANTSDSLANRQRILAAEFENLKARIGEGVVPVMENLFDVASTGVGAFTGLDDALGGNLGKFAAYGTAALLASGSVSFVAGQAITARANLLSMASGVQTLVGSLGGLKTAAIGAGAVLAGVVASVELAKLDDAASAKRAERVFGMDRLVAALREGGEEADRQVARFVALADKLGFLEEAVKRVADVNPELSSSLIEAAEAAGIEDDKIRELRDVLDNHQSAAAAATEGQAGLSGAMGESASMTDTATSALKDYADQIAATFSPILAMQDALVGAEDAQRAVAEAQNALNEALAGGDPTVIAEAQRAYDGALRDAQGALLDVQQAQITLNDAVASGEVSVADAQAQLYDWAIAAGYSEEQARSMADGLAHAAGAAAFLGAQDPTVSVSVTKEAAISEIDAIQARINALHGRDVGIRIVSTGVGSAGGGVFRFHEGGVVPGPRGQEVAAILQAGERVIPLDAQNLVAAQIPAVSAMPPAGGGVLEIRFTGNPNGLDSYLMRQIRTGSIQLRDGNGGRVRVA